MKKAVLFLLVCTAFGCQKAPIPQRKVDVVLVGAGVMSATLGSLLNELDPGLSIEVFEGLDGVAKESSDAWNNAGTGHAAYCELNYTPEKEDGSIDIRTATQINEAFDLSLQFWAYQVEHKNLGTPSTFIHRVPHMSLVWGDANVNFLKKRYDTLIKNPLFAGMQFSEKRDEVGQWVPLMMEGREPGQKVAATRIERGSDVDFGSLTRSLFDSLLRSKQNQLHVQHQVIDLKRNDDATWTVIAKDCSTKELKSVKAKFVFIGAGGGALKLLQKSGIPEGKGFGGVPVGGQWLVTHNPELIEKHFGKVYGKPSLGAPPMSVPHLDTRYIDGKKALLFGPFATFSTKFLKTGSWLDLPASITLDNAVPMFESAWGNIPLIRYLISQVLLTRNQRLAALKAYFPNAKLEDWTLLTAGQRVQMIKNDPVKGGILQFGTELVGSKDGSLVALLGASPGASIAVDIMLRLLQKSFKDKLETPEWQAKLKEMIPSYGQELAKNPALLDKVRTWHDQVLGLMPQ